MKKGEYIDFSSSFQPVEDEIVQLTQDIEDERIEGNIQRQEINELMNRIQMLAQEGDCPIPEMQPLELRELDALNTKLSDLFMAGTQDDIKASKLSELSATDVAVSSIAGLVAVVIDVLIIGTPEIVKIYRGGETFDGSVLTKAIRNLTEGPISDFAEQLSKLCKVPYDISLVKDGMIPNNHRLRSLSHDPFFGLFFAVFDIAFSTTTFIDNGGCLRILPNTNNIKSLPQKFLTVFYYIGHTVSDLFTVRGIPIPGFFITQFFAGGEPDASISKIAETMYIDGYDMRHLASMSAAVIAKDVVISAYLHLTKHSEPPFIEPIAEKEIRLRHEEIRKIKMRFIADSIAISGNTVKFFAPPNCCNPCALNAAEWFSFLRSSLQAANASSQDFTADQVTYNRKDIDRKWDELLAHDEGDE